ncbi:putative FBD-associated F-box protein At5g56390 [Triticum urartu]|uniref:putative FBD-associated F-box protein At5g56390 n=1 Tax=Triticum urartu TaxID=4572 RepID=UPI00204443E4|nr:putative FBD-associated F-box protein At5g56390 [Triticum urartu]
MENMPEQRRPKLSDAADAGGGEDRLGALHDDILIRILLKSGDAAAAARTSVLARRWRHLWALLPALYFFRPTDPRRIRSALAAHQAPVLQALVVIAQGASPGSAGAWLPIAARRLSGPLVFRVLRRSTAKKRAALKLPCFEKATKIVLRLGFLRLALPPSGVFTRIHLLMLMEVRLRGPCGLGEAVSSPRCPSLRRLVVKDAYGLGDLTIHSECLLKLELFRLPDLQSLTVVAPALQLLKLDNCFALSSRQPVANISAPHLMWLAWMDDYDQNSVQLGEMAYLQSLVTQHFIMYGEDYHSSHNRNGVCLLRHFEHLHRLVLTLQCPKDIANKKYFMEQITRLPNIKLLELGITACGHSFGASLFHVMRMCTAIRALVLGLNVALEDEEETLCPSDCICDQPPSWKTEELVLNRLEVVEISGFRGTEHEINAVKQICSWATVLRRMTVKFHDSITENKAEVLCELLVTFSRLGLDMIFIYRMP